MIGKIKNLICIYLFQIDKFINTCVLTFFLIVCICYQLANKTINLLFAIQLFIYIIYGGRTIIDFVDGATVSVRKRVTFRPLVSTYVKLPFSLRVPKKYIFEKYPNGKYKISKFITSIAPFKQR
jgi:hypothetical protein